jgi:hypothetical protein
MATKAYVFPVPGREADIAAIEALVLAGGCELVRPNDPAAAYPQAVVEADVVVILICPQTLDDPLTVQVVELANREGKRIVGVWAGDADPNALPQVLRDYGDANVRMDAASIAQSVCGGASIWETPTGDKRPPPKTPRHKKR